MRKGRLHKFSRDHYNYINQIFGDVGVRTFIQDLFPNQYRFSVEENKAHGFHHTLRDSTGKLVYCSKTCKDQVSRNDTLCQSYTLLRYFGVTIPREGKQQCMIRLYRYLLGIKEVREEIEMYVWMNKTGEGRLRGMLIPKIHKVLDDWEEFGFLYFDGNQNVG